MTNATDKALAFTVIAQNIVNPTKIVSNYCKHADYLIDDIVVEEITFERCRQRVKLAYRHGNINDDDQIWKDLQLGELLRFVHTDFDDSLIKSMKKREINARTKKLFARSALSDEIERIYRGHGFFTMKGHPVHYLVATDDKIMQEEICTLLTTALYANKRLTSKRICNIYLQEQHAPYDEIEALYHMSKTGVVINYLHEFEEDSDRQRDGVQNNVLNACKIPSAKPGPSLSHLSSCSFPRLQHQRVGGYNGSHRKQERPSMTDEAREELASIYEQACGQQDFGNGRFVRTMVEKAILAQSSRLIKSGVEGLNKNELNLTRLEDIQDYLASQNSRISKVKIGFCA